MEEHIASVGRVDVFHVSGEDFLDIHFASPLMLVVECGYTLHPIITPVNNKIWGDNKYLARCLAYRHPIVLCFTLNFHPTCYRQFFTPVASTAYPRIARVSALCVVNHGACKVDFCL